MADEEKTETTDAAPDEAPEQAADAPASEQAAESPAEDPPAQESAAPEDAPAEQAQAQPQADAEPAEVLSPKERRKQKRATASSPAAAQRSGADRATERGETRRRNAADRSRYRQRTREKHRGDAAGEGTPPADRVPGPKKVRLGKVVSTKADKTITVRIEVARRHPTYEKVVRRSATLHAHDGENAAGEGDTVRIVETRPLSKTKRWRLLEIVEKAR